MNIHDAEIYGSSHALIHKMLNNIYVSIYVYDGWLGKIILQKSIQVIELTLNKVANIVQT